MNKGKHPHQPELPAHPWHGLSLTEPCAVALGLFDGVHRGHQAILNKTCEIASKLKIQSAVFTFENHPRCILNHSRGPLPGLLLPLERRIELLKECGIDRVLVSRFNLNWADTTPHDFAQKFLAGALRARHVVVGFNYCFGRGAEGKTRHLEEFGRRFGFEVDVVPAYLQDGEEISSTRIRQAIIQGNVRQATVCLGRPYEISGMVAKGDGRGKTLGFPTANIASDIPSILQEGVYAVDVFKLEDEGAVAMGMGMFFIGSRKTFYQEEAAPAYEVHIPGFNGNLYGSLLRVCILEKVRDPVKFASPEELSAQLAKDQVACEKIWRESRVK